MFSRGIIEHGPVKPGAVVLDVVTSPVQAPFFIAAGASHLNQQAEIRKQTEELLAALEKKPELLLDPDANERWRHAGLSRGVAEWVVYKVESPDGFNEDMLFELLRHDHQVKGEIIYNVVIPPRASLALLERLYVNYATQCLKEEFRHGDRHMPSLARSYQRKAVLIQCYERSDEWDAFIQLQPAKAKELLAAYKGQDRRGMPDWVRYLDSAMERENSGENARIRARRQVIERVERDSGVLFKQDFWGEISDPELRREVKWWIRDRFYRPELKFTDDQLFELFRRDSVVPREVRLSEFPVSLGPSRRPDFFERIYQDRLIHFPEGSGLEMQYWCARAVGEERWTMEKCAAPFAKRYPEKARELIRKCEGLPARPGFLWELERELR
jgi:hypothetical protein